MIVSQFIDYWIAFCFAAMGALVTGAYRLLKGKLVEHFTEHEALQEGVKALLQDRLVQAHDYYCEKGYCNAHSLKNIYNMYEQYKKLEGNGAIDELMAEIKELPHQDIKEK